MKNNTLLLIGCILAFSNTFALTDTEMKANVDKAFEICTKELETATQKQHKFKDQPRLSSSGTGILTANDFQETITQFSQKTNGDKRKAYELLDEIKKLDGDAKTKKIAQLNDHLQQAAQGCKNMGTGLKDAFCKNAGLKEKLKCKAGW
jgi:replication-associated recombination protein RarA